MSGEIWRTARSLPTKPPLCRALHPDDGTKPARCQRAAGHASDHHGAGRYWPRKPA